VQLGVVFDRLKDVSKIEQFDLENILVRYGGAVLNTVPKVIIFMEERFHSIRESRAVQP
jgi:hypothetical protein